MTDDPRERMLDAHTEHARQSDERHSQALDSRARQAEQRREELASAELYDRVRETIRPRLPQWADRSHKGDNDLYQQYGRDTVAGNSTRRNDRPPR